MFRALIPPIFRSTRLCVTACGIMHPRCCRPVVHWVHYTTKCNTQSSAPEDGRNQRPKHVELIGIINKPLLLHLVGCLYHLYSKLRFKLTWSVGVCVVLQEIDALLEQSIRGRISSASVCDCVTQKILIYYFTLQIDICIDIYNKNGFSK